MKKNKFIVICFLITIFAFVFGLSYAMNSGQNLSSISGSKINVDEEAFGDLSFNSTQFELVPIFDETVSWENGNVIKLKFLVGGDKENDIDNIIYDISLNDLNLDCNLLSPYLKWRLIKNEEVISEGSLDYKFDTITDGRMVLTPIQQDLKDYSEDKTTYDEYYFYMWLSDSCQTEDLNSCIYAEDQTNLIDKEITGRINVELRVGTKEELVRNPSETLNENSCINEMRTETDEDR